MIMMYVETHPAAAALQLPELTGERTSAPESTGKPEEHRELHTEPAATADSTHSHCWDTLYNITNTPTLMLSSLKQR